VYVNDEWVGLLKLGLFFVLCKTLLTFRRMLYVYQGDVWITEAGRAHPTFKAISESKEFEGKKLAEALTFCYYVYTKIDLISNRKNFYWQMPPNERKDRVVSDFKLFKGSYDHLENSKEYIAFRDFYVSLMQSDNDRNYETFRAKSEHWRSQLACLDNTPKKELEIAKALQTSSELAEEYKVKSELETLDQNQKGMGLYLFEVPEDTKPHDMRLNL
jgi:coenzyme F420-reducing hydrogenase alpha subunit